MKNDSKAVMEKPTKIWGTYLRNETVNVRPVESSGKWSTLLVKGQDKKKDPFIYNKVKRSYQVPLNNHRRGGGVKMILDDLERCHIKKYIGKYSEGMTQQEFFEEELGTNLNITLAAEKNFWRTDRRGRVTMTKEGMTLNLNYAVDMLKYLILLSNKKLISPSYDDRILKATYEFMIVDEGRVTSKKVEDAELKAKAYIKFAEITSNITKMKGFIRSLGRTVPNNNSEDWLKAEVLMVLEESTHNFLAIVNHPQYDKRIFIQEATDAGAIKKMGPKRYTLDNGIELGDLSDAINYLENPENQEVKMRIKTQIELSKK